LPLMYFFCRDLLTREKSRLPHTFFFSERLAFLCFIFPIPCPHWRLLANPRRLFICPPRSLRLNDPSLMFPFYRKLPQASAPDSIAPGNETLKSWFPPPTQIPPTDPFHPMQGFSRPCACPCLITPPPPEQTPPFAQAVRIFTPPQKMSFLVIVQLQLPQRESFYQRSPPSPLN